MMDITQAGGFIGMLAFIVTLITEATKELPLFKSIPTDLQVIVLSVALALAALFAAAEGAAPAWYMILGAVLMGIVAAFIAMYGWATFRDIKQRLLPGEYEDE